MGFRGSRVQIPPSRLLEEEGPAATFAVGLLSGGVTQRFSSCNNGFRAYCIDTETIGASSGAHVGRRPTRRMYPRIVAVLGIAVVATAEKRRRPRHGSYNRVRCELGPFCFQARCEGEIVAWHVVVRSGQVHLLQQRRESGVRAQGREQERALDAVHRTCALDIGSLQPLNRRVLLAETRVDIGHVVG